jgi:hypothetical protein
MSEEKEDVLCPYLKRAMTKAAEQVFEDKIQAILDARSNGYSAGGGLTFGELLQRLHAEYQFNRDVVGILNTVLSAADPKEKVRELLSELESNPAAVIESEIRGKVRAGTWSELVVNGSYPYTEKRIRDAGTGLVKMRNLEIMLDKEGNECVVPIS